MGSKAQGHHLSKDKFIPELGCGAQKFLWSFPLKNKSLVLESFIRRKRTFVSKAQNEGFKIKLYSFSASEGMQKYRGF